MAKPAEIRIIETSYKNYRFRSRLEARWAVYFDSIGITWEYEKEGFEWPDGIRYLPDFWFPQVKMWGEVKPFRFTDDELEKVKRLVIGTGHSCILLEGFPDAKAYDVTSKSWIESDTEIYARAWNCVLTNYHGYLTDEHRFYSCPGEDDWECNNFPDVIKAIEKAKSARFEFGEKG
jgi:hypothetical protein